MGKRPLWGNNQLRALPSPTAGQHLSVSGGRVEETRGRMLIKKILKVLPSLNPQQHEASLCLDSERITSTVLRTRWQERWRALRKPPDPPPASREKKLPSPLARSPPSSDRTSRTALGAKKRLAVPRDPRTGSHHVTAGCRSQLQTWSRTSCQDLCSLRARYHQTVR